MTPEERAEPIVTRLIEAFTKGKLITVGEMKQLIADAIREAEAAAYDRGFAEGSDTPRTIHEE